MANPRTAAAAKALAATAAAAVLLVLVRSYRNRRREGGEKSAGAAASAGGAPPLLQPAMEGDLAKVKSIVDDRLSSLATPETSSGEDSAVARFRSVKSLVDSPDPQGNAAVHAASFAGRLPVLRYLAEECGADLTAANGMGCAPLWLAAGYGRAEALGYIVQRIKMRLEAVRGDDRATAGRELMAELCAANNSGDTPLIAAAHKGHGECARALLRAAGEAVERGSAEMLRLENKGGDTALHVAAGNDEAELHVSAGDVGGRNAVLEVLLEFADDFGPPSDRGGGGDRPVDLRNSRGLTPLLLAAERNSAPSVRLLLSRSAKPLRDSNGLHPLAVAAFCGCFDSASALLSSADPPYALLLNRKCGENECTPLWFAARTGNAKMCEMLLEKGADPAASNKEGLTPLGAAEKFKKEKAAEVLRGWKGRA